VFAVFPIEGVEGFERLALELTGVRLAPGARSRTADALARLMEELGVVDTEEMLAACAAHAEGAALVRRLVGELTVKETYLFRDPCQFDALRDIVLPECLASCRSANRPLRVWSAGCATGEEAYSVAMLMAESAEGTRGVVLGTDISDAAIDSARTGVMNAMRLATDAGRYRPTVARWTRAYPGGFRLADEPRALLRFTTHSLLRDPVPSGQDLIMCRNVMVYMRPDDQRVLIGRLHSALRPGGYLMLGEAELLHVMDHEFERVPHAGAVFYRRPLDRGEPRA
jgi:chemotaxis methyl-accepting protein methylase